MVQCEERGNEQSEDKGQAGCHAKGVAERLAFGN